MLLEYRFSTLPAPIQVNPVGVRGTARINLAVFNPGKVYCSEIMVSVPVGGTETDFCLEAPAASVNTAKWTVASVRVAAGADPEYPHQLRALVIFNCRDRADYLIDYSLVLSITGVPNNMGGTFSYATQERSGPNPDELSPKHFASRLTKQDAIFTLGNFIAATKEAPTIPATRFANGQPVRLSWESNGTWFQLYAKGDAAPIYAGPAIAHELPGLSADTQFILVASVTGNPGQDSPSAGYAPIFLYDALNVVIADPDLTPKTVRAKGDVSTEAKVSAVTASVTGEASAGSVRAGEVTVTGATTLQGVTVKTNAVVEGTLKVTGETTLGSVTAGTVGVTTVNGGTVNAQAINVNGPGNSLYVRSGQIFIDCGDRNGSQVFNTSRRAPTGWFQNRSGREADYVTGVVGWVAQQSDCGIYSNGRIASAGRMAMITDLPTRDGARVVTSPLTLHAELHLTGSARLTGGRAEVSFAGDTADLIVASSEHPYQVLLTPAGQCNGLAVVERTGTHFIVEELGGGTSAAGFDWMVITRQPNPDGAGVLELPARLPQVQIPDAPDGSLSER